MDVFNMVKSITCQLLIIFGLFHLHSCRVVISSTPSIKTNSGKVVGEISVYSIGAVAYFFGIPYARPPVGDLRFSKPQPVERWNDILNATQQVSYCYEPVTSARFVHRKYSEDCLTLSIAVPVKALNEPGTRPVIIDLGRDLSLDTYHGYLTEFYPLVVKQDLILVRVSCRRNIFGYAYTKANDGLDGNYALYDQNMAFEWIKNNIKNFGGNPQKITIFGNSAAAQLVTAHILSPYSRGMFQNAIVQSGTFQTLNDNKQLRVDEATNIVIERVGCKKARNVLDCLRQKKPQDLIDALPRRFAAFEPVPASDYIPYTSEQIISYSRGKKFTNELNINILAGYSQGEASVLLSAIAPNIFADAELTKEDADDVMEMLFTPQAIEKITEIYIGDINQPLSIRKIQNGLTKLINDIIITCPLVSTAYGTSISQNITRTYFFVFNHLINDHTNVLCNSQLEEGVCPGDSTACEWGVPYTDEYSARFSNSDRKMADKMMAVFGNFARTGNPSTRDETWQSFNTDPHKYPAYILTSKETIKDYSIGKYCMENVKLLESSLIDPKYYPLDEFTIPEQKKVDYRSFLKKVLRKQLYYGAFQNF